MTADPLPAVILAGGASRRMGSDKALLLLDGETFLARTCKRIAHQCAPVLVSRNGDDPLPVHGASTVKDRSATHEGPLAGILAALDYLEKENSAASHMLSVAVDTPFFPSNLAEQLLAANPAADEILLAKSAERVHPVFALWPLTLRNVLADWLLHGSNRRLMSFIAAHPHREVRFSHVETSQGAIDPFFNINTPDDLDTAHSIAKLIGSA